MAFTLNKVVPWGRNLNEYRKMFDLSDNDLQKKIISFGDGPASFNYEMKQLAHKVISVDPIYQFSAARLQARIQETKDDVIKQTVNNMENFIWDDIRSVKELEKRRMSAMQLFLEDFKTGKREGRYIAHELPQKTAFKECCFDLGLSSHFLLLYSQLGLDFHISAISEMLRCCKEIRIFPLLNLNAERSELLPEIIEYYKSTRSVEVKKVGYEFQKNGNEMLTII